LAIIEVAWRDVYCGVRFFDEQLRRVYEVYCRRLAPDRLFVIGGRQWRYADPAQPEFDESASRREFRYPPTAGRQARSTARLASRLAAIRRTPGIRKLLAGRPEVR
jgi:hypothetical protein